MVTGISNAIFDFNSFSLQIPYINCIPLFCTVIYELFILYAVLLAKVKIIVCTIKASSFPINNSAVSSFDEVKHFITDKTIFLKMLLEKILIKNHIHNKCEPFL